MVTVAIKGHQIGGRPNVLLRYARSSNGAFAVMALGLVFLGMGAGILIASNTVLVLVVTRARV
jgi:hypothetical protein